MTQPEVKVNYNETLTRFEWEQYYNAEKKRKHLELRRKIVQKSLGVVVGIGAIILPIAEGCLIGGILLGALSLFLLCSDNAFREISEDEL